MENVILTKSTTKGTIEIGLTRYLDTALLTTHINGKPLEHCQKLYPVDQVFSKQKLHAVPAGITHVVGKVGLTDPEAQTVRAALETSQAIIDTEPAVALRKLRSKREDLVASVRGWDEERQHQSDKAWERGDEAGAFVGNKVKEAEAKAAEARRALAEFDAANPEVIEAIRKEREESAARHAWD